MIHYASWQFLLHFERKDIHYIICIIFRAREIP